MVQMSRAHGFRSRAKCRGRGTFFCTSHGLQMILAGKKANESASPPNYSVLMYNYAVQDHSFQEDLVGSLTGNGRTLEQGMAPRLAYTARRGTCYYWSSLDVTCKSRIPRWRHVFDALLIGLFIASTIQPNFSMSTGGYAVSGLPLGSRVGVVHTPKLLKVAPSFSLSPVLPVSPRLNIFLAWLSAEGSIGTKWQY